MSKFSIALVCLFLTLLSLDAMAILPAPTVRSINYPDQTKWYMPALSIEFEWTRVEEATAYYYTIDKNPDTEPAIGGSGVESTTLRTAKYKKNDGIWYFHVRAAKGTNLGETAHFKVQLDGTNPDFAETAPLKATPTSEGYIKLSWGEAIDGASGIAYYELYRAAIFDFDLRSANKKYSPIVETSYIDTNNMEQNMTFFYLLAAVDNAGNQSRVSNKASATTFAFCDVNVSLGAALSDDKKKLVISITADANLYGSTLTATWPDGKNTVFFSNTAVANYNTEFDLNETPQGVIKLDLDARERLGDDCSRSKEFIYDIAAPSVQITFPELNETVSQEVKVKARAFDNGDYKSGISSVEFFVRTEQWQSLGMMTADANDVYSIDWNTFNFSNGRYQLKAIAKDTVGNMAETGSGAVILNTLYQQGDAKAAINAAQDSRKEAIRFIDFLKKKNITSDNLNYFIDAADSNLSKANELYEKGGNEYTNSRTYAKKAQEIFDSIKDKITTEKKDGGAFIYNKEQVAILLNASPLDKSLVEEAKLLIEKASPQRKLEIYKITDGNDTYFRANVVISFSLSQDYLAEKDTNFLNLLEFIPKEFAANASGIYSAYEYAVIEDDPIIGFKIDKDTISAGEISYGLNKNLTEEEADAIIQNNLVNKYVVPPVLLQANISIAPPGLQLPTIPALGISSETIMGAVVVLVLIILVVVAFAVYRRRKTEKEPDLSVFE